MEFQHQVSPQETGRFYWVRRVPCSSTLIVQHVWKKKPNSAPSFTYNKGLLSIYNMPGSGHVDGGQVNPETQMMSVINAVQKLIN